MQSKLDKIKKQLHELLIKKFSVLNRQLIANYYLKGNGLEIGAMESPLKPINSNEMKYLDRCSKIESEKLFPELKGKLVNVDYIADLDNFSNTFLGEFDFIIANHVLEHLENPIGVLLTLVNNLKSGGRLFFALPDKRYTFDCNRDKTTIEHLFEDYETGFEKNRYDHYFDFVKNTEHGLGKNEIEIDEIIKQLMKINFSIHFHVWDHESYIEFFNATIIKYKVPIRIIFSKESNGEENESILIFEKI